MWWRGRSLVVLLVVAAVLPAGADARRLRPRAFASCAALVGYGERHYGVTHGIPARSVVPLAGPTIAPRPSPPSDGVTAQPQAAAPASEGAGTTFSTTNNQEEGVDEPDIVKTDGSTIFAVAQGRLHALAVGAGAPRLVGSLDLPDGAFDARLLLRGKRLIVISGGAPVPVPLGAAIAAPFPVAQRTVVTEVDVGDPAAMKVARTVAIDGSFVDARQNGS